jgi:hypothetical protein
VLGGKDGRLDPASVLIGARDDVVFHQVHLRLLLSLKTSAPLAESRPPLLFTSYAASKKRKKKPC